MATDKEVKIEDQGSYDEPTQADKDLTAFVVDHCDRWRDYRNTNEKDLNEWRIAAGMATKPVYETTSDIKSIQSAAGII